MEIVEGIRMSTTWETIEERQRRVRGTRTTNAMARAAEQVPTGDSLEATFAERPFISREDLRSITRQHYEGPVVTLYLNFSPERLVRADPPVLRSVFHSLRHRTLEARKPYIESLPHAQRLRVPVDLDDVMDFLEGYEPQGARALVIFKSGKQLNRPVPLPVRVADSLTIEADPYVEPLEAIMEEQDRVLVLDVSMAKTTVSIYELGYEERIQSIESDLSKEATDVLRADKEERHRLIHLVWHFKSSAQLADRVFRERHCDLVALIGEDIVVGEFENYLPKALQQALLATIRLSPQDGPNIRRLAVDRALAEHRKGEEEAVIEELGFFEGHGRLAAGLERVISAANLFLMRGLVLDDDLTQPGYVCRDHHFLALTPGACPFDGKELLDTENVVDELVEIARLHGVEVMLVTQLRDLLRPYSGIAAVLVTAVPLDELRPVSVTSSNWSQPKP